MNHDAAACHKWHTAIEDYYQELLDELTAEEQSEWDEISKPEK